MFSAIRASRSLSSSRSPLRLRLLHTGTPPALSPSQPSGKDPRLSQGTVATSGHQHSGDPHDQTARAGQRINQQHQQSSESTPYDAASPAGDKQADHSGFSGNPEGVGFAEQVGSATPLSEKGGPRPSPGEGKGGTQDSTPPGLLATLKSKLGLATSAGEAKQNRGGGVGVTGTGALPFERKPEEGRRPYHSSAVCAQDKTRGQAPAESRKPKERTTAGQNEHLHHKAPGTPDHGKGNASSDPKLPSHQMDKAFGQQRRPFSTSTPNFDKHTAESYFKDVDKAPPASQKTYQVDGSGTGSDVQRPNEPSGDWSRAGPETKEYRTVSKGDKYDVPPSSGPEKDEKLRYGNMPEYDSSQKSSSSADKANQGPEGESRGGRKPEHS